MYGFAVHSTAPQGFAIQANLFVGKAGQSGLHPTQKSFGKDARLQAVYDIAQPIMRRNTIRPFQKLSKSAFFFFGKSFHADPVFNTVEHGAEDEHDDVGEWVQFIFGLAAWVT